MHIVGELEIMMPPLPTVLQPESGLLPLPGTVAVTIVQEAAVFCCKAETMLFPRICYLDLPGPKLLKNFGELDF